MGRSMNKAAAAILLVLVGAPVAPTENPAEAEGRTPFQAPIAFRAGRQHSVFVGPDGTLWTLGKGSRGSVAKGIDGLASGNGPEEDSPAPSAATHLGAVLSLAAGRSHTVAVAPDHTIWAWGENGNGQLGDGSTTDRDDPGQVNGITGVTSLAAGRDHTLAWQVGGPLWAWGSNGDGQLGNGSSFDTGVPTKVSGLTEVVAAAGGAGHSLAVKQDGTVWAWGSNRSGQLGDGTAFGTATPVPVAGIEPASGFSTGLGAGHGGWAADYGLVQDSGAGLVHRFSLRVAFGSRVQPGPQAPNTPPR